MLTVASAANAIHYKIWDDTNTRAQPYRCQIFRSIAPVGWRILGDVCETVLERDVPTGVPSDDSVRATLWVPADGPLVAAPTSYELVWQNVGLDKESHFGQVSFWRPIAPDGYRALGYVASMMHDVPPSLDLMRCVHESVCERGSVEPNALAQHHRLMLSSRKYSLWSDRMSGCSFGDVTLWRVGPPTADDDATATAATATTRYRPCGLFVAERSHSRPAANDNRFWVLNESSLQSLDRALFVTLRTSTESVAASALDSAPPPAASSSLDSSLSGSTDDSLASAMYRARHEWTTKRVLKHLTPEPGCDATAPALETSRSSVSNLTFLIAGMAGRADVSLSSLLFGTAVSDEIASTQGQVNECDPVVLVHPVHHRIRIIQSAGIFDPTPLEERNRGGLSDSTASLKAERTMSNHERTVRFLNRINTGIDFLIATIPFAESSAANVTEMCRFITELLQLRGNAGCQVAVLVTDSWRRTSNLYGLSLEEMALHDGLSADPTAVPRAIAALADCLEERHLDEEGLFRISGSVVQMKQLGLQLSDGKPVNLGEWETHTIASLLKITLRELEPHPLLYPLIADQEVTSSLLALPDAERIGAVSNLLLSHRFSPRSVSVVRRVMLLLHKVLQHSSKNLMTANNLGIVFGPTLFVRDRSELMEAAHRLCSFMITNAPSIFDALDAAQAPGFEAPEDLPSERWTRARHVVVGTIQEQLQQHELLRQRSVPIVCISLRSPRASGTNADLSLLPDGSSWISSLADAVIQLNRQQSAALHEQPAASSAAATLPAEETSSVIQSVLRKLTFR